MKSLSLSTFFVSIITYSQNIGISMDMPSVKLPAKVVSFFTSFKKFFIVFMGMIPDIPSFDNRAQLVILSLGIPFILDVIFVWFVSPLVRTIFHIIDLVCIFIFTYVCAISMFEGVTDLTYSAIPITMLYLMGHYFFAHKEKDEQTISITDISHDICSHFMDGIIPGVTTTHSLEEINMNLKHFSNLIEILPQKSTFGVCFIIFLIGALMFSLALAATKIIVIEDLVLPPTFVAFYPYFGYTFGLLLIVVAIMKLTQCGSQLILKFKGFCKRWGLRLLMLALDMLYIPIVSLLVSICVPREMKCDNSMYQKTIFETKNVFDMFINHTTACASCSKVYSANDTSICGISCNGGSLLRVDDDPSLLFYNDVLRISGGTILYTIVFILLGIPIMWGYLVHRNRSFILSVNVYGRTPDEKWVSIVTRLKTTGIFLFQDLTVKRPGWSVVLLVSKFLIMAFSTIAAKLYKPFVIILPVFHFILFLFTLILKPYLYPVNNILDCMLYLINFLFACIPVVGYYGYNIPEGFAFTLTLFLFFLPFGSLIYILNKINNPIGLEDDPTVVKEVCNQENKENKETKTPTKKQKPKKPIKKNTRQEEEPLLPSDENSQYSDYSENTKPVPQENIPDKLPDPENPSSFENNEVKKPRNRVELPLIDMDPKPDEIKPETEKEDVNTPLPTNRLTKIGDEDILKDAILVEDGVSIEPGQLNSIHDSMDSLKPNVVNPSEPTAIVPFEVNRKLLARRMEAMYQMLDVVIDGSTIDILTKVLNVVVLFGIAAFGWYVGSITTLHKDRIYTC